MSSRKTLLITGEIYHVFNRGVGQQPIIHSKFDYSRFLESMGYYRFKDHHLRFSHYARLEKKLKDRYIDAFYSNSGQIEILAFCIMPNHYHFLLRQREDLGISTFIRLFQNSYARYINIKYERFGSLFQSPFKSVRIESEEQMLHVWRYIHLNPLSSYVLRDFSQLEEYPWTSYKDYLSPYPRLFVDTNVIKSLLGNRESMRSFTENQVDYQRVLERIKHVTFD